MSLQFCKLCSCADLVPLWEDAKGGQWFRCLWCGSDSSTWQYEQIAGMYDESYIAHQRHIGGGSLQASAEAQRHNLDWFVDHRGNAPGKDFLDVGFCEGGALWGMQERGFSVHGWDCNPAAYLGPHTTITPSFRANAFPQRYDLVLCREVIHHCPPPRDLIAEIHAATDPGGLLQLQTPRPWHQVHPIPYQQGHLFLLSPILCRYWLETAGWDILEERRWDFGMVFLCKRI